MQLSSETLDLEELCQRIAEKIQVTPSRETAIEKQAEFYEQLRQLKEYGAQLTKAINIALRETEKAFAFSISDIGESTTFRSPTATLSVSAEGYYSVSNPEGLFKHLNEDTVRFTEIVSKKTALKKFCEDILSSGQDIPNCIKYTIVPAIRMTKHAL